MSDNEDSFDKAIQFAKVILTTHMHEIMGGIEYKKSSMLLASGVDTNKFLPDGRRWTVAGIHLGEELRNSLLQMLDDKEARFTAKCILGSGRLLNQSEYDPIAFDVVLELIACIHEQGEPLPEPLASFLVEYLRGTKKRPKQNGAYSAEKAARNLYLGMTVDLLKSLGHQPTRNDVSARGSGCDAVAIAGAKLGIPDLSYDVVRKSWDTYKKDHCVGNIP